MSIEIKELVVKFNVTEKREQIKNNTGNDISGINYKKLVKDCTDKVLRELEFRTER
jgi:uncharacterized protein DUF5908